MNIGLNQPDATEAAAMDNMRMMSHRICFSIAPHRLYDKRYFISEEVQFPEAWKKSNFHLPFPAFGAFLLLSLGVTIVQFYSKLRTTTVKIVILNTVTIALAILFANWRLKTGKAKPTISYETEEEETKSES